MFVAALATGLIISILQAATQINEATLSFVPKLVIMFGTLIMVGPWDDHPADRLHPPAVRIHTGHHWLASFK